MEADSPQDRPLLVAYDLRDVLDRIQHGVDTANGSLALKADKNDLTKLSDELHGRITDVSRHQEEINRTTALDIAAVQAGAAKSAGWRDGAVATIGIIGGLVVALLLHAAHVI